MAIIPPYMRCLFCQDLTIQRRLHFKRGRKCLINCRVLIKLATQMRAFHNVTVVASSARLLRSIMTTESAIVMPFIQSPAFCELPK